jgi:hypothetical protein
MQDDRCIQEFYGKQMVFLSSYLVGRTQFDLTALNSVERACIHRRRTVRNPLVSKEIRTNENQFIEDNNHSNRNLNGLIR